MGLLCFYFSSLKNWGVDCWTMTASRAGDFTTGRGKWGEVITFRPADSRGAKCSCLPLDTPESAVKSVDLPGSEAPTLRPSLSPGLRPAAASPRRPRLALGSPPPATSRTRSNLLYKTKQQPHTCVCTPAATDTQGVLRSSALGHVSFSSFQPPHPLTTSSPGCPAARNKKWGSYSRSGAFLARSLGYSHH